MPSTGRVIMKDDSFFKSFLKNRYKTTTWYEIIGLSFFYGVAALLFAYLSVYVTVIAIAGILWAISLPNGIIYILIFLGFIASVIVVGLIILLCEAITYDSKGRR